MELLFKSNIISVCNLKRYIITHGFTKKTQRTPVNEIKHAKVLKKGYLTEKAILESALTVAHAGQSAGLSQRQPAKTYNQH